MPDTKPEKPKPSGGGSDRKGRAGVWVAHDDDFTVWRVFRGRLAAFIWTNDQPAKLRVDFIEYGADPRELAK